MAKPSHKKITLVGTIAERKGELGIAFNSKPLYQHFLKTHGHIGDDVTVEIALRRPTRTQAQNNFLYVYYGLISTSTGHTPEEVDEWARGKILTKGITEVFGDKVRITKNPKDLNVSEFSEFLYRIEELTGVPIPDTTKFKLAVTKAEYKDLKEEQEQIYRNLRTGH